MLKGKSDQRERTAFAQEFSASWPDVLHDMLEFIELTHLAAGNGRPGVVAIQLARALVAASDLQPHVRRFRDRLSQQLPGMQIVVKAEHHPLHRIEIHYRDRP